jgi:hypothetical protein
MNFQQQQPQGSISTNIQLPEGVRNVGDSISSSLENMTSKMNESVQGFSEQAQGSIEAGSEASQGFLQSNTLFAKFAFVILIVIVFILLLSLGIMLLNYFLSSSENPYLVKGMVDGNSSFTIPQDPGNSESVLIERSNNQESGMEFTWSTWIYINELNTGDDYQMFQHIFNKGNDTYDVAGIANVANGPGLYLKQKVGDDSENTASIFVIMDSKTGATNDNTNSLEVNEIPLKKWVNIIIRMKNTILEVYINGVVSGRLQFRDVPIQNFYDVNVCKNGGINGKISNLRYYKEALTIFDITNIVSSGPELRRFKFDIKKMNTYNYLSNMWYTNKLY